MFSLWNVVIMVLLKKLKTNRDIENSPVRNIYPRRNRVWEPGDQLRCQKVQILNHQRELTAKEVE
jgi:hypothetical protein